MADLGDTIAAVATPPGVGGIAIVRVSGPRAGEIGAALVRGWRGEPLPLRGRDVCSGRVVAPETGRTLDEVVALWMPGPASYTREDVLELQCHGGQAAVTEVLDAVVARGARLADPGEFTLRAFLGGRIDLVQAEAVLDVIRARTAESLRIHENLLGGGLSQVLEGWQGALGRVLAMLEAHLDFPEEELGELDLEGVSEALQGLSEAMAETLQTYPWGRMSREGFRVVLTGAPNTGKSSLLNRLAREDRAIVSATPGTTRDAIEAAVNAGGVPVAIVDTAGLRPPRDEVEEEGLRRARKAVEDADLVVLVCDGSRDLEAEEEAEAARLAARGALPVMNKVDLGRWPEARLGEIFSRIPVSVSARTGDGLGGLLSAFRDAAWGRGGPTVSAPLTRARHRRAVEAARASIGRAIELLESDAFLEVAASEVHGARRHLAELLGVGTGGDVLDAIFSEFCIGK